ncbi:hypothetical protein [Gordonia otitidis]|nr:hypothetical protein [Gordonia otitidis]
MNAPTLVSSIASHYAAERPSTAALATPDNICRTPNIATTTLGPKHSCR